MNAAAEDRKKELLDQEYDALTRRTDRLFAYLMILQWGVAVVVALTLSPSAWAGKTLTTSDHILTAIGLGALISALPIYLAVRHPGRPFTRYSMAVAQGLWSALFIHLTGGRIETHFHVFGSLACLAFYRDVRILLSASLVVALDHIVRGAYWPESVYGAAHPEWWQFLEHGVWMAFIDAALLATCLSGRRDLERLCEQQAKVEASAQFLQGAAQDMRKHVESKTDLLRNTLQRLKQTQIELETHREREKAILEERQRELFECLEQMPIGVYVVNNAGIPVFANAEAVRILGKGIDAGTQVGNLTSAYSLYRRGTDTPYPEEELPFVRALHGETSSKDDLEVVGPNGRLQLSARATPIRGHGGEIRFALLVLEDVTEKFRAEAERLQSQKLESVGQLAAGVAHEINTPMQYIGDNSHFVRLASSNVLEMLDYYQSELEKRGDAEALKAAKAQAKSLKLDFLKRKLPRALASTIEGVDTVSRLVQALKEFSHPGTGEKVPTDLNKAIETTATVSKNEWKYVATLELDLDPTLEMVPCLPGELNQVFLNLIVNAAHAIAAGQTEDSGLGTITVRTRAESGHAVITIADTGTGIPEEIRAKVFDPFFTTKPVGQGSGQGLAIARSIVVDKHGGSIRIDSELGQGTCFTICLPLHAEAALKGAA